MEAAGARPDGHLVRLPLVLPVGRRGGGRVPPARGGGDPAAGRGHLVLLLLVVGPVLATAQAGAQAPT